MFIDRFGGFVQVFQKNGSLQSQENASPGSVPDRQPAHCQPVSLEHVVHQSDTISKHLFVLRHKQFETLFRFKSYLMWGTPKSRTPLSHPTKFPVDSFLNLSPCWVPAHEPPNDAGARCRKLLSSPSNRRRERRQPSSS